MKNVWDSGEMAAASAHMQAKRASPAYMAPELFQSGPQSTASDLWALGCILYECAAGQPPFSASSPTQLVQDIMAADPAPVAGAG